MKIAGTFEKGGDVMQQSEVIPDPFWSLLGNDPNTPRAEVHTEVSRSHDLGGGWVKCSYAITVQCPQTKAHLDAAAELVFRTAVEYVNDGMTFLAPGVAPMDLPPVKK